MARRRPLRRLLRLPAGQALRGARLRPRDGAAGATERALSPRGPPGGLPRPERRGAPDRRGRGAAAQGVGLLPLPRGCRAHHRRGRRRAVHRHRRGQPRRAVEHRLSRQRDRAAPPRRRRAGDERPEGRIRAVRRGHRRSHSARSSCRTSEVAGRWPSPRTSCMPRSTSSFRGPSARFPSTCARSTCIDCTRITASSSRSSSRCCSTATSRAARTCSIRSRLRHGARAGARVGARRDRCRARGVQLPADRRQDGGVRRRRARRRAARRVRAARHARGEAAHAAAAT